MAPMKKAMNAMKALKASSKVMTLADQHEMKTKACSGLLESLATLATTEVKKTGSSQFLACAGSRPVRS